MTSLLDIRAVGRASTSTGNRVRSARRAAELTQAELAARIGASRQTVVAIENGGYAPSVYLALALGRELGRSVEELFTEEEPS